MAKFGVRGVTWWVIALGLALLSPAAAWAADALAIDHNAPDSFRLDDEVAVTRSLVIEVELDDE